MTKEGIIIIGAVAVAVLAVGALAFAMSTGSVGNGSGDKYIQNTEAGVLTVSPTESMDLGSVPYGGGKVSRIFEIKNTSGSTVKLRKMTTSCMCTTVKVKIGERETKSFGMEMKGDLNPLVDFDLPAGQTAQAIFIFDPAAHGPQGVGPFDRVVTLYFDAGYKELKFEGEVVK